MTVPWWGLAALAALAVWLGRRALRAWAERASIRLRARFRARLEPFQLLQRRAVQDRLMADPVVRDATAAHAAAAGISAERAAAEVEAYVREIVPFFNVLSYYRLGYGSARAVLSLLYRVRVIDRDKSTPALIPSEDVVVYLMNHRSNADYVVVAYVLARVVSISYAVGEWARTWPLEYIFKSFGSYFVRRRYRVPLYHTVLERYVQLITRNGVTQGIFPEGGLTRDGALRPPKLGLLDYLVRTVADADFDRDIWLVPVGINYDRVLEDRALIQERLVGVRRRGRLRQLGSTLRFVGRNLLRLATGRLRSYGRVAVAFGPPLSVRTWLGTRPRDVVRLPKDTRLGELEVLAAEMMERIGRTVPVTPVPLAARALLSGGTSAVGREVLEGRMAQDRDALKHRGAMLALPDGPIAVVWEEALRSLGRRRLVHVEGDTIVLLPGERPLLEYYANSIRQWFDTANGDVWSPAAEPDPTLPRLARRDEISIETGEHHRGRAGGA